MATVLHVVDAETAPDSLDALSRLSGDAAIISIGPAPDHAGLSGRVRPEHCTLGCPWLAGVRLRRELPAGGRPDVIHAWSAKSASAAWAIAGAGREARVVVSLAAVPGAGRLRRLARKARTGRLILTLPTDRARGRAIRGGFPQASAHVLPHPAWPPERAELGREEIRQRAGVPPGANVLLSLGYDAHSHRTVRWAQALVRRMGVDLWCLLPATASESVRRFSARLDSDAEVRFAPRDLSTPDLPAAADFAAFLPERSQATGCLCDAMAADLPIAASRTPEALSCLADPPAALIVQPGDVRAAAAAALQFIEDGELADRLAREAARRAEQAYSVEASRSLLADLYASPA